jgi:N-dimethylarginine dimethylaminohydrolase
MNKSLSINNEFSRLRKVVIGLGTPYQRDKEKVAGEMQEFPFVPETAWKEAVLALTYPSEELLIREYAGYVATLEKYGIEVLRPDPEAAYSFDYTCPRDVGFVIGDTFFVSSMAVQSRAEEYKTVMGHLAGVSSDKIIRVPENVLIEGGDVIVLDERTVLVGINTRTDEKGFAFLKAYFAASAISVMPVFHTQLHLDCCLNPLGMGHMLIHPESLERNLGETMQLLKRYEWVEVNSAEREHLATNVLSINQQTIIARNHSSCARVNNLLKKLGYTIEEIAFDGTPATGGSFRCASLVLQRDTISS